MTPASSSNFEDTSQRGILQILTLFQTAPQSVLQKTRQTHRKPEVKMPRKREEGTEALKKVKRNTSRERQAAWGSRQDVSQ